MDKVELARLRSLFARMLKENGVEFSGETEIHTVKYMDRNGNYDSVGIFAKNRNDLFNGWVHYSKKIGIPIGSFTVKGFAGLLDNLK